MRNELLIRLRRAAGLTQKQIAEACGVNYRWIGKLEHGEAQLSNITFANAYRLAKALGVSMEELRAAGKSETL